MAVYLWNRPGRLSESHSGTRSKSQMCSVPWFSFSRRPPQCISCGAASLKSSPSRTAARYSSPLTSVTHLREKLGLRRRKLHERQQMSEVAPNLPVQILMGLPFFDIAKRVAIVGFLVKITGHEALCGLQRQHERSHGLDQGGADYLRRTASASASAHRISQTKSRSASEQLAIITVKQH